MHELWPYLGDLHQPLHAHHVAAGVILIFCSMLCGTIIGLERERKDKPAGLRTVVLICMGSTLFTLASIFVGEDFGSDRGRIAAQVVVGIGFLGAGAIIRERGRVLGMTTGATVWTVAAIGVLIGAGYAAAGLLFTGLVLLLLTALGEFERLYFDPCRWTRAKIIYRPDRGKTRVHILRLLDLARVPEHAWSISPQGDLEMMEIRYCFAHRRHRMFLARIMQLHEVVEFRGEYAGPEKPA